MQDSKAMQEAWKVTEQEVEEILRKHFGDRPIPSRTDEVPDEDCHVIRYEDHCEHVGEWVWAMA